MNDTATELGMIAGTIALPILLGFIGHKIGQRMSEDSDNPKRWPMIVGIVLGLIAAATNLNNGPGEDPVYRGSTDVEGAE